MGFPSCCDEGKHEYYGRSIAKVFSHLTAAVGVSKKKMSIDSVRNAVLLYYYLTGRVNPFCAVLFL